MVLHSLFAPLCMSLLTLCKSSRFRIFLSTYSAWFNKYELNLLVDFIFVFLKLHNKKQSFSLLTGFLHIFYKKMYIQILVLGKVYLPNFCIEIFCRFQRYLLSDQLGEPLSVFLLLLLRTIRNFIRHHGVSYFELFLQD